MSEERSDDGIGLSDGLGLLPCPFCGSDAALKHYGDGSPDGWTYRVYCTGRRAGKTAQCAVEPSTLSYGYRDDAVSGWNTRKPNA